MKLEALPTPCAVVDLALLERNTQRMGERMTRLGVRLRPHVKTHKCVEAARHQVRGHFGGITVSTMAEARFFARFGFQDITYAVPIAPHRIPEGGNLARKVESFRVLVDHEQSLAALEEYGRAQKHRLSVLLKVDCGYHRAGVNPEEPRAIELGLRLARSPYVSFEGLLTHAGHAYHAGSAEEIRIVARQERDVMLAFAEKLRAARAPVREISVGSTPTMSLAEDLSGVTEARPGNYVFFDRFQEKIGSCRAEDVAFSILVTVIGVYPARNKLLVDGGALAFSKDEGPTHVDPEGGFGAFFALDGRVLPELRMSSLSQEHGEVCGTRPLDFSTYPLGTRLRVVPNHSCLAAALHDRYYVVQDDRVVDEWRPVRGW